jgi:oligopeptide/dipeptide ABC transporter ATP-binding protein
MVQAKQLTKYFPIRQSFLAKVLARAEDLMVQAVDNVNLEVMPRETLSLVGESGCGKTTLGRTLIRLYEPTAGQIFFEGEEITHLSGASLLAYRRQAQIIFQNPYASLNPRKTVRQTLAVPLQQRGVVDPVAIEEETLYLLGRVGLTPRHIDSYPHQFSGGQRQRIGIARALALRPKFVVCDEPVSSLDVSIRAQVLNLLEELQDEFHLTYLFIAHDLSVVYYISDRVAVMYLGQIVEIAETEELFANPQHPYTQALMAAAPAVERAGRKERIILEGSVPSPINPPRGCRFHTRCFAKIGRICEEETPELRQTEAGHAVACHLYA